MGKLRIEKVRTRRQLRDFILLPRKIYENDPLWVPPLWLLEKLDYRSGGNPVLTRSSHVKMIAYSGDRPVGRIIPYIDPRHNDYFKTKRGLFGSFESIDDSEAGELLFSEAERWLRSRGMTEVRGPINPVAESWGFLLEGSTPPVYMSPHNPLYYNNFLVNRDYRKAKDLLVSEADVGRGYKIPERFTGFADKILKRNPELTVRMIDRKNLRQEALYILTILNTAVSGNWGYVPVEEDEMMEIVGTLKFILDEEAIWFVEDRGRPVGVALGFPDINVLFSKIKGRLNPASLYTLLTERKKIRDYRLWGLAVLPEYQGRGLDVLLYVSLARALAPRKIRLEANYMLEDNPHILNALEKMGLTPVKRYRVYEKEL